MTSPLTAEEIFHLAREIPGLDDRAGLLDRACGNDGSLRAKVEALLQADAEAGEFLKTAAEAVQSRESFTTALAAKPEELRGDGFGRYRLLQQIGEGGFGVVYMAEQREPVKRRVALKVIKLGMDTKQVIARFEAERQALAMMDHPNIAKVLDAGSSESGRPYFVMEYIKGVPILEYCDTEELETRQRLSLFTKVCQAIQHAHQKGIIHRDIKPSNVLITLHDGVPVPKVIDFGIAKATSAELTSRTLFTEHRQMIGTPAYMSPEQAEMSGLDIDTRSDIYSLGVLLYEVLTGTTPFSNKDLASKGFAEMMRIIREDEPQKPSTRISSLGDAGPRTAKQRQTDTAKLGSALRGDLDWIIMRCLEKNRTRRYETANGLAMDIERHLNDEPVSASPPSRRYRMQKFIKRNRAGVIAAGAVGVALLLGVIGTTTGMITATMARNEAIVAKDSEREAKQEALKNANRATASAEREKEAKLDADRKRQEAETNLEYARKGIAILGSVFENLSPRQDYASIAELRNALKANLTKATQDLEGSTIGDPLPVAEMQITLANSLVALGAAEDAIPLLVKARETRQAELGLDHPETLWSMHFLAAAYWEADELQRALPLAEETFQLRMITLGPDDPATLASMNNLASVYTYLRQFDKSIPLFEEVLARQEAMMGRDDPELLVIMGNLGMNYRDAGRFNEAMPLLEEVLTRMEATAGPDNPYTLITMTNLAQAYQNASKFDLALPLYEETIKRAKATLGPDHPHTLKTLMSLANAYWMARQFDKAIPLYEENLKRLETTLGRDHAATLGVATDLAENYRGADRRDEGIALLEETIERARAVLGPKHPVTLYAINNLSVAYMETGKLDLALPLLEESLTVLKATLGREHLQTLSAINNLATAYWSSSHLEKSIPLFEEALPICVANLGPMHPTTLQVSANMVANYIDAGRPAEAIPLLEESRLNFRDQPEEEGITFQLIGAYNLLGPELCAEHLARLVPTLRDERGKDHLYTLVAENNLGFALTRLRKFEEAEPMLRDVIERELRTLGEGHMLLLQTRTNLGEMYQLQRQLAEAEELLRKCMVERQELEPDSFRLASNQSMLGQVLSLQEKFEEAESLLLAGYNGLKANADSTPDWGRYYLPDTLEWLTQLYDAWDKPDEAKKWRREIEVSKAVLGQEKDGP